MPESSLDVSPWAQAREGDQALCGERGRLRPWAAVALALMDLGCEQGVRGAVFLKKSLHRHLLREHLSPGEGS